MFTNEFLRAALLFVAASATGLSGMTCISGCSLNRNDLLGEPALMKGTYSPLWGASVEVSTQFTGKGGMDIGSNGVRKFMVDISSDPVPVEAARAQALVTAKELFQMQDALYRYQVDKAYNAINQALMLAAQYVGGGQPIPPELLNTVNTLGASVNVPIPTATVGPAVIVDGPE